MSLTGIIFDIDRFATHDGPGIRTTIFLKGCPLSCLWCHSPESQSPNRQLLFRPDRCTACGLCLQACPRGALSMNGQKVALNSDLCDSCGICCETCYSGALELAGYEASVEEVADKVSRDAAFFSTSGGGVTLSGGEPLMQPEFSFELLSAFKEKNIHTAVETTGYGSSQALLRLAAVTDLFLYDLKAMDDETHRRYTGVSNRRILENLRFLCAEGSNIQTRVPCIPGVNDSEEQIRALAETAADAGVRSLALLPYNSAAPAKYAWISRPYELEDLKRQDNEYMEALAALCREYGLTVEIIG